MRPVTTAVILAAGMGIRLQEAGLGIPKGFLQLGERPIVEESILKLLEIGIRRIILVTGHRDDHYLKLALRYPGTIELVHNAAFAQTGSLHSLVCAAPKITADFLLLESDLIYERRALSECLGCRHDDAILISGATFSGDEVYVEASGDRLVNMSKNRAELKGQIAGELVGISKVSMTLYQALLKVAADLSRTHGHSRFHYETDGFVRAGRDFPIGVHLVPDLVWAEIDDAAQLQRARERVYPALQAAENQPGPSFVSLP